MSRRGEVEEYIEEREKKHLSRKILDENCLKFLCTCFLLISHSIINLVYSCELSALDFHSHKNTLFNEIMKKIIEKREALEENIIKREGNFL